MTFTTGTKLGAYEILGLLGAGGMGEVYRARDSKLKREIAIKVLPDAFSRHAEQIAEAMEVAHEKGIIHRDLKPANIKLTPGGVVKVLDFGLAKARETSVQETTSTSPTQVTTQGTGTVMGTPAYMSPEQAKGEESDRTADVWAFGCVLYEMLTGRRVFEGGNTTEVLGGVLKTEPDWRLLPGETPEGIRRLLRRCLQKERRLRLHDMADARIEIEEVQSESPRDGDVIRSAPGRTSWLAWMVATAVLILVAIAALVLVFRPPPSLPEVHVEITTPPTLDPVTLAISPDGEKVVFVASSEGRSLLWLRSLRTGSLQPLPGTDYAQYPFWSPDSRSLGFFAGGKLNRIGVDGGSVQTLGNAQAGLGGTWNEDGTILFSTSTGRPISRISATVGGEPVGVTKVEAPQTTHRFPQFLPDGNHFLYYVTGTPEVRGIYIGQLDGSEGRRLVAETDTLAVYTSSGHVLFVRQGILFAQAFDLKRLQPTGEPFRVAEQIAVNSRVVGELALSTSTTGSIAYRTTSAAGRRRIEWLDRSGKQTGTLGDDIEGFSPVLSPVGKRVALYRTEGGNTDIWWFDLERGMRRSKFTFDAAGDNSPVWSRDGSRILFSTNRTGTRSIFEGPITSTGSEKLFLQTDQNIVPMDWSADGKTLLYRSNDPKTNFDIWAMSTVDQKTFPVVRGSFEEREAQFSPDGKWIAYQSDESGRFEIYAQPFPGPGTKVTISDNGGAQVRWRSDGMLFYIALDGRLMEVHTRLSSDGLTIDAGTPVPLFPTRVVGGPVQATDPQQYSVSPDGRFLISTVTEEANSPITVILNWKAKP